MSPEDVLAEIRKQAPLAATDGYALLNVGRSAVPFPITDDPLQMMWNHSLRWTRMESAPAAGPRR